MRPRSCSRTVKSTRIRSRFCSVAISVPAETYCPTSMRGMPMMPANGALTAFCSSTASRRWSCDVEAARSDSAVSRLADELTPRSLSVLTRSSAWRSRSTAARAAIRSARSMASSICTSSWPSSMRSLAVKRISSTTPEVWTARSTPCAAPTVPKASMTGCQVVASTSLADTVTAGGCMVAKNSSIACWRNRLKPTRPPQITPSRTMAITIRFIIARLLSSRKASVGLELCLQQGPAAGHRNRLPWRGAITIPSRR
jgi:hypothetical protein